MVAYLLQAARTTALLASYKAVMAWIGLGKATVRMTVVAGGKFRAWTSEQLRALMAVGFFSLVTVYFSSMLAVIGYAAVLMIKADPQHVFTPGQLADHVSVALWPPVAVWVVVWVAACIIVFFLGASAICMCLGLLLQIGSPPSANDVPAPLLFDTGITAVIALVVAMAVPRIASASAKAF